MLRLCTTLMITTLVALVAPWMGDQMLNDMFCCKWDWLDSWAVHWACTATCLMTTLRPGNKAEQSMGYIGCGTGFESSVRERALACFHTHSIGWLTGKHSQTWGWVVTSNQLLRRGAFAGRHGLYLLSHFQNVAVLPSMCVRVASVVRCILLACRCWVALPVS